MAGLNSSPTVSRMILSATRGVPMVVGIHWMDNHFFDPLVATFTGRLVIGAAIVLWALAILLASKILAVDI